jgi:putative ABC transport system permease protein
MTDRQLGGMVVMEGALYGLYASLLGGAAGILFYKLIFSNIATLQRVPFMVPWPSVLAASAGALVIGAVSALVPLRRIGGMSVVTSIRAEE